MSDYLAIPPARGLSGALRVPPSKSATNRALVAAALTGAPVEILRPLESNDTAALRRCLAAMGARIEATGEGLRVSGPVSGAPGGPVTLDVADSGTAARFLTAVCSAVPGRFLLTGSARLRERPIGELVDALSGGGAQIRYGARRASCRSRSREGRWGRASWPSTHRDRASFSRRCSSRASPSREAWRSAPRARSRRPRTSA